VEGLGSFVEWETMRDEGFEVDETGGDEADCFGVLVRVAVEEIKGWPSAHIRNRDRSHIDTAQTKKGDRVGLAMAGGLTYLIC
jgi:hypothetical protein